MDELKCSVDTDFLPPNIYIFTIDLIVPDQIIKLVQFRKLVLQKSNLSYGHV